jgi:hypothetical protein
MTTPNKNNILSAAELEKMFRDQFESDLKHLEAALAYSPNAEAAEACRRLIKFIKAALALPSENFLELLAREVNR